jgi:NAD(P) transhydrogenase subunit beta
MSEVRTARWGNWAGALGMLLAVIGTLMGPEVTDYRWVALAMVVGSLVGAPMALLMPMTAVSQRTALSHAFRALATPTPPARTATFTAI